MASPRRTTLKEIGETLAFVVERMATKDDLKQLPTSDEVRSIVRHEINALVPCIINEKLQPVIEELVSIRHDLALLKRQAENAGGLTKEIDHALGRIAAIEKHLGINKKIAA